MKILLVDDDGDLRRGLSAILSQFDYETLEADNGLTALQMAIEHEPNVILSDYDMPIMNGLTLYLALRANIHTQHIGFILMTGSAKLFDLPDWHLAALNPDQILRKPFDVDRLLEKLEQVTHGHLVSEKPTSLTD